MTFSAHLTMQTVLKAIDPDRPVLIAGPTASGKSALALEIASHQGGVIINADASQVYGCFRILTARPSAEEENAAPHALYGHVAADQTYSAGHWLRDVVPLIKKGTRPIIIGGTGLYFSALTQGLAQIPATPADVRAKGDEMSLSDLRSALDAQTADRIDVQNRARVQRAWEVLQATGRGLAAWQAETTPPALPLDQAQPIVFDTTRDWLNARIKRRFDLMIEQGALDEVRHIHPDYDPSLPAHRAIGVPELISYLNGATTLDEARDKAIIATRQFAKRQRTWFRSKMKDWQGFTP